MDASYGHIKSNRKLTIASFSALLLGKISIFIPNKSLEEKYRLDTTCSMNKSNIQWSNFKLMIYAILQMV